MFVGIAVFAGEVAGRTGGSGPLVSRANGHFDPLDASIRFLMLSRLNEPDVALAG
jgi:hypothetical protein